MPCMRRVKNQEISQLKAVLVAKDASLKAAKAEMLESRVVLREKDVQLTAAYEGLTAASRERADLRMQLIETQVRA